MSRMPRSTWAGPALMALILLLAAGCAATRPPAAPVAATPLVAAATRPPLAQGLPTLTPIPGLKATLTALPKQPPMPAEQARPYRELRAAVEQCNAYNPNRKLGILSQIDYVLQPATVPSDFVVLYGNRWPGRMIYGAAYLSALEWKLAGRDPTSCLYPIGVSFNALLLALGEETFPEFH
ncbi:MAG: hypothetical protein ACP5UQ_09975 [Anaerolineae bacterium]